MAFDFDNIIDDVEEKDATLIVDSLNLAFRWKHQGRTDFRYDFERTVESLAESYRCDKIVITSDWGSSSYRRGLDENYKMNRKEKFSEQTEEEKIAFEEFFEEYEETLELLSAKYPVLRYKGVEADDIAAHIVKYKSKYGMNRVWLVSSDRDWDLLVEENVSRFSYVTRKEVTLENWKEHYSVSPEQYISYKCLLGDKGDNVPGFPGVGPKKAESLVKAYGDAYSVYDATPIDSHYKFIQAINQNAEQILKNYELMDLITYCDEAIGSDNITDIEGKMLNEL